MRRRTFEDIIQEEFRWPVAGDMPFVDATDPAENANIAHGAHSRLVLMTDGYKKRADIMVGHPFRSTKLLAHQAKAWS